MVTKLVRKQIRSMGEIDWGDIPNNTGMRLLWGENQNLLKLYQQAVKAEVGRINQYPSPTKQALKEKLAAYNRVRPANIIPTNGSDEALELIAKVFIDNDDEVLIPSPAYPCFTSVSQMMGAKIVNIPLEIDFSLNLNQLLQKVTPKTKIIWIANPNNPTGNILLPQDKIAQLVKQVDCIVVFDECYFELADVTATPFIQRYPNIIVTRSFSKVFALAGARLGYIIANKQATTYFNRLENANQVFNINRFALAAGIALFANSTTIPQAISELKELKSDFERLLSTIPKIKVLPTQTTFCLLDLKETKKSAKTLQTQLAQRGIYVKDCSIYQGLGDNYVYLGIPNRDKQRIFVKEVNKILNLL